jgi:hypothetical protein
MPEQRDHTIDNQLGPKTEIRQVGFYPADHPHYPGFKSFWSVLCHVQGARGPFIEFRIVSYGPWEMAPWEKAPGQEDSSG